MVIYLLLRFDRDFGLHRISNETLLVRGMIHLFELLLFGCFSPENFNRSFRVTRVMASLPSAFFSMWPTASS